MAFDQKIFLVQVLDQRTGRIEPEEVEASSPQEVEASFRSRRGKIVVSIADQSEPDTSDAIESVPQGDPWFDVHFIDLHTAEETHKTVQAQSADDIKRVLRSHGKLLISAKRFTPPPPERTRRIAATEGPVRRKRKAIPRDVQRKVYERDEGKCVECGKGENLHFDHIVPFSKGGSSTERNVQLLCEGCNWSKGNRI